MPHPSWNESYASGQLPWDTGQPDPLLTEFVTAGGVLPSRTLEIGAGTGTNAIWMAEHGFDVLGVDVSPLAVVAMTAEGSGAAARDGIEHLALRPGQGSAVPLSKAVACNTNDVGHLEGWPAHRFLSSSTAGSAICSSGLIAA